MKLRSLSGIALAAIALLASCRPYDERAHQRKVTRKPPMTAEQLAKAQEEEARKKAEEEAKKQQVTQTGGVTQPGGVAPTNPTPGADTTSATPSQGGATNPTPPTPPQPPVEKRPDYPVAKKVLGREGFVYSPYNNKIISVRDEQDRLLPSGTLVADPTFDESEKKYFRVP